MKGEVGVRVGYLHELREPQHSEDVEEEQARAQVLRVEIWQQRGACSVVRGAAAQVCGAAASSTYDRVAARRHAAGPTAGLITKY